MIKATWKCSNCDHTKITEYNDEDFNTKTLEEFKKSRHQCIKCKEQCSMMITEIVKTT